MYIEWISITFYVRNAGTSGWAQLDALETILNNPRKEIIDEAGFLIKGRTVERDFFTCTRCILEYR